MREAELAQAVAIADDLRTLQRAESGAAAPAPVTVSDADELAVKLERRLAVLDERDFDLTARERDVAERERRLARLWLDVRKRSLDMTNRGSRARGPRGRERRLADVISEGPRGAPLPPPHAPRAGHLGRERSPCRSAVLPARIPEA